MWDYVLIVWTFGGWAIALLALALHSWRAGLATLAVWLISLIVTGVWWLNQPSAPAILSGESRKTSEPDH